VDRTGSFLGDDRFRGAGGVRGGGTDRQGHPDGGGRLRDFLGPKNPNVVGSFPDGRREINWDGVPDAVAAPNRMPPDFFNVNSPRGAVFFTPGTGFQISADSDNPTHTPVLFGNLQPAFPLRFRAFSPERLFTSLGSSIVETTFFEPGTRRRPRWTASVWSSRT
jgi:hypothetical protein